MATFTAIPKNEFTDNTDALVLYWKLDEGSGSSAADSSGAGNAGAIIGGAPFVTGILNSAIDLDGTDDYIKKSSPSFIDNTAGSVSIWVKFDTLITAQIMFAVSVNGSADDDLYLTFRGDQNKQIEFVLSVNGSVTLVLATANNAITDTNFHHIAVTSDGSTIRLYIDAIEQTLTASAGTNSGQWFDDATQADTFSIGTILRASALSLLDGKLDEVRVYSSSISESLITSLYNEYLQNIFSGVNKNNTTFSGIVKS